MAKIKTSKPTVKRCVKCGEPIADPQLEGPERCESCADPP